MSRRVVALLVAGTILSCGFCFLVRQLEDDRFHADFSRLADSLAVDLQRTKDTNLGQLDNLVGLYRASNFVDPNEFRAYAEVILVKHPTIKALEWIPRVTRAQRQAFESTSWDEFSDPLTIVEPGPNGLVPALDRPEYFPVYYAEPRDENIEAFGFDLASETARGSALKQAAEIGGGVQVATRPIMLVQSQSRGVGFVVVSPIYDDDDPANPNPNPNPQGNALIGYVASAA